VIAVTGARGGVGSRVLRALRGRGEPVVGLARRPGAGDRYADYDDPASLREGLAGVRTLVFVSSDGVAETMRRHHEHVVAAAVDAGVEHVVYTSILGQPLASRFYYAAVHRETEAAVAASGLSHCFARTSIFADFFVETWIEPARADGVLALPAGDGRMSLLTRDDTARALARLAEAGRTGIADLTGPEALTAAEVADACGLGYEPLEEAEYRHRLAAQPAWLVEAYSSMFAGVRAGDWATVDRTDLGFRRESVAARLARWSAGS
jgi:NAD(P)H dehydrogenase (quinone)